MALSTISSHMMIQTAIPKPTNVDFLATIGSFTTAFSGTAGSYVATTSKTITGTQFYNGTYTIKCNYWTMEGTVSNPSSCLGMMFDSNNNTFGSSVWTNSGVVNYNYNGNQISSIGQAYNTSTGAYNLGATYSTTANSINYVGDYIDVIFPMPVILKKYKTMTRTNATARYPRQRYLFGSNDGTTWELLYSWLVSSAITSGTFSEATISNTSSYTYIRMVINTVNSTSGGFWNLAEINLIFDVA